MFKILFYSLIFINFSIAQSQNAVNIVSSSIESYGGDRFNKARIKFDFRDKSYSIEHNNGLFEYRRNFSSDGNTIEDILNNDGFSRQVNSEKVELEEKWINAYSNSVNSVVYFALLPYKLGDDAVFLKLLGEEKLKGTIYYKVKVTFSEQSGGEDYQDIFVYWFDKEDYSMDYLAYSYETDGGGLRFREAFNFRKVNGLGFQDYNNYKANLNEFAVDELGQLFNDGKLELLSKIELKNIEVK